MNTPSAWVLSAVLIAGGVCAGGYFIGHGISHRNDSEGTISVKGLSERDVPASIAIWSISYQSVGNSLADINSALEKSTGSVVAFLKERGFEDSEITVQPPSVRDHSFDVRKEDEPPPENRYSAFQSVLLRTSKVDQVKPGTAFNRAEIDAAAKAAGVKIGKGDVVLFHTGWMAMAKTDPKQFIAVQPGLGEGGAEYLASLGVVMIGADTAALEAIPSEDPTRPFVVHQTLLTKHGVHILENIDTAELAKDGATEFMFVLGQPRLQGTVQAVVNPVAIR